MEGRGQGLAQALGLKEVPLIKGRAVGQGEAGQKIILVKGDCFGQGGETVGAKLALGMAVGLTAGQPLLKEAHIDPEGLVRLGLQGHRLAVGQQPALAEDFLQGGEGPAQIETGLPGLKVGPEKGGQGLAAVAQAGHGQISQEGFGLAAADIERPAVALQARGAKKIELELGHQYTSTG